MTFCLQECLRAVGLQHHYDRFTSVGVCRAAHLSALTMEDFSILGIRSMDDRTRLFSLIEIVKTLDLESLEYEDDDVYNADDRSVNYSFGGPEEESYDDENESNAGVAESESFLRPKNVCRRLDFSRENVNTDSVCERSGKENENYHPDVHFHQSEHHMVANIKSVSTEGSPMFHSHARSSPRNFSKPRLTAQPSKRVGNKRDLHYDKKSTNRKVINCNRTSEHTWKQTLMYEPQKTAGYNYGLPLSSPPATHKKKPGEQRISVCVRKRPQTYTERRRAEADVVTTPNRECVIVHESKEAVDLTQYILQHRFYFDQVFGEESSNEEVYQRTAYPLVQHMLSGGNATCFAYGQTGAGKTHTMLGSSPRRPGLYALAVRDIFTHLSNMYSRSPLQVYVSFFEIYCGQLFDLLDHRKRLFAREDGQKVVHIAGLREVRVDSVSSLLEVIAEGTEERTQGVSGVNPLSSRSHALLQIQLRGLNQQVAGRMWFVDLAGSERASDTNEPNRQSRMEGAEINQSLLALKECIRSLDQEQSHTPFRQSKLTQVLKDSFIGDSMTCMIANISPGHSATEHTLNTLRYADRVKELRGQGGLRGGRGKISPKRNLSKSNSSTSMSSRGSSSEGGSICVRGKSPPKKPKFGRPREVPIPASSATRLATGDPIFCSTPKNSRRRAETKADKDKQLRLEETTPAGGLLGDGDNGKRVERKTVRYEETDCASHLNFRGSRCYQSERESQQSTCKEGTERKVRRQMQNNVDSSIGGVCVKKRDLLMYNERDQEKVMHLRQYHQQLQQFVPSSSSSSCHLFLPSSTSTPLSSSLPSSSSSLQESSSHSALTYQGLEGVLDAYGAKVEERTDRNSGQTCDHDSEVGGLRKEYSRPAGLKDGGGRKWAWVTTTETQQTGGTTAARPAALKAQMSHKCDSKAWAEVDEEVLDVPADELWSNEENESNDGDSLFTHPAAESGHHRAPAERPLSPNCEHTDLPLTPNKTTELPFRLNDTRNTSNSLHLTPQKSMTGASPSSQRGRKHLFSADANTRGFSHTQADSQSPIILIKSKVKRSILSQEDSLSLVTDPLSISMLQVDQQAATASFLQGGPKTSPPIRNGECRLPCMEMTREKTNCPSNPNNTTSMTGIKKQDHNMQKQPCIFNVTAPSDGAVGQEKTAPEQHCTNNSLPATNLNLSLQLNHWTNSDVQESKSTQKTRNMIDLASLEDVSTTQWHIVQAHWEQLEEMEALFHKEGSLLCQQPDMAFTEYVHKLEEIMRRKAQCVNSMIAQLQPFLTVCQSDTQTQPKRK